MYFVFQREGQKNKAPHLLMLKLIRIQAAEVRHGHIFQEEILALSLFWHGVRRKTRKADGTVLLGTRGEQEVIVVMYLKVRFCLCRFHYSSFQ